VAAFVPSGPIVIGIDHTLERRRGRRIGPAGHFYDASRSSAEVNVTSRGLRWLSAMVLVEVPFAGRIWALPVLVIQRWIMTLISAATHWMFTLPLGPLSALTNSRSSSSASDGQTIGPRPGLPSQSWDGL